MANYCSNYITFTKPETRAWIQEHLIDKYSTYSFLTEILIPGFDNIKNPYEYMGSKWIHVYDLSSDCVSCTSAWSPIVPLCQKLSQAFNDVITIEYEEPGNNLFGDAKFNKGIGESDNRYGSELEMKIALNGDLSSVFIIPHHFPELSKAIADKKISSETVLQIELDVNDSEYDMITNSVKNYRNFHSYEDSEGDVIFLEAPEHFESISSMLLSEQNVKLTKFEV